MCVNTMDKKKEDTKEVKLDKNIKVTKKTTNSKSDKKNKQKSELKNNKLSTSNQLNVDNSSNKVTKSAKVSKNQETKKVKKDNTSKVLDQKKSDKKSQKSNKLKKKSKTKKEKLLKSKITVFVFIGIIVAFALIVFGIIKIVEYFDMMKYKKYEEKVETYGFVELYDNNRAKFSDYITKSEAIKLVLGVTFNIYDITQVYQINDTFNYENEPWVLYASEKGLIGEDEINEKNEDSKATYVDIIRYFYNAKTNILNKEVNTSENDKIKDLKKYKPDEQIAILDMVNSGIIAQRIDRINGHNKARKAYVNEIIVNFAEKYNTITLDNEKLNINKDKIPENENDYPYTLANVDKSVYEISNYTQYASKYKTAKEVYKDIKVLYKQIQDVISIYTDSVLNVDYSTINKDDLKNNLQKISLYTITDEKIDSYIEYVKYNRIKITATSKVQFPAVYFDGLFYRVRTKITYKIENTVNFENVFLMDEDETYENGEHTIIVDIPMSKDMNGKAMYINLKPLNDQIAGNVKVELENF